MKLFNYYTCLFIIVTFISCVDKPNTLNYINIYDKKNNIVYKYNPKDSNAIIYLDNDLGT